MRIPEKKARTRAEKIVEDAEKLAEQMVATARMRIDEESFAKGQTWEAGVHEATSRMQKSVAAEIADARAAAVAHAERESEIARQKVAWIEHSLDQKISEAVAEEHSRGEALRHDQTKELLEVRRRRLTSG